MTYKEYLTDFKGKTGDLDETEKSGVFIFYYGISEERPSEITEVGGAWGGGDDFVVVKVMRPLGGIHVIAIPLSSFIIQVIGRVKL